MLQILTNGSSLATELGIRSPSQRTACPESVAYDWGRGGAEEGDAVAPVIHRSSISETMSD